MNPRIVMPLDGSSQQKDHSDCEIQNQHVYVEKSNEANGNVETISVMPDSTLIILEEGNHIRSETHVPSAPSSSGDNNDTLEDEASSALEPKTKMLMSLPICPYCNIPVPEKYQDECHYPTPKRDGGTVTVPGHHLCNLLAESNIPRSNWPLIMEARKRYYKYKAVDKTITRITNLENSLTRLNALDEDEFKDVWSPLKKREAQLRRDITRMVKEMSKTDSMVKWLLEQNGVGPITAAGIVATLYPLDRFNRVSSLWHYTGHLPKEEAKDEKGKLTYSPNAKRVLNELANSSIKNRESYIRIRYDVIRGRMDEKHPDYTKGHLMNASLFRAKKMFLKDLWVQSHPLEAHVNVESKVNVPMRTDEI